MDSLTILSTKAELPCSDDMTSDQADDGRFDPDKWFLSKAGLIVLLMGVALFACGAFLGRTPAGAIAFGFCVVLSTTFSAFAGNNRVSTATLVIDIVLIALFALGAAVLYFR